MISGTCGEILGFDTFAYSSGNTLIMPYTCNFNGKQSFNIHLTNIITKNIDSHTKSPSNIIQSIPIDTASSSISYIKNADFNFVINQEIIDDMTIEIKDDQNNYLNFNNQHWNLTLYFSIIKDIDRFNYFNNFHNILNYK
jgi:translation elongation factor P/translation initiation factor 5A